MNFVYVHTHDSGRIMQPYGVAADNPALMELANEGTVFRQMYCTAPTCSPSRAGMLTGMAPHSCGMLGLAHRGWSLNDYSRHLGNYLATQGYYTALIGVHHECDKKNASVIGYSEWTYEAGKGNDETDRNHITRVKDFLAGAKDLGRPFFLSFGMRNTHRPWPKNPCPPVDYVKPPYYIADTPENRLDYCDYLESLSHADACIGELISSLKENGLWDDTIVLYTTDHGLAYPDAKCTLYDSGIGVAFILRRPGQKHSVCNALCTQLDLFPTVCDLLGVKKPDWLQGRSMLPLLDGSAEEINEFVFAEVTFHATYQPMRCVRSKHYKLIRFYDGGELLKAPNIDESSAKDLYLSKPLPRQPMAKEMFFDLDADPAERINLVGNPDYESEYLRHAAALDDWMVRTDDPMLRGENMYTLGRGKIINPLDGWAPDSKSTYVIE